MSEDIIKITKEESDQRTIEMLTAFLKPADDDPIMPGHGLFKKWKVTPTLRRELRLWIEGGLAPGFKGYFEDVNAKVTKEEILDEEAVKTVGDLMDLIWKKIPKDHKAP